MLISWSKGPPENNIYGVEPSLSTCSNKMHISSSTGLTLEFIAAQWFTRCMLLHVCFIGGCYWPANKHQGLPHASSAEELVASISTGCQVSCWLMLAPALFFRIASQPEINGGLNGFHMTWAHSLSNNKSQPLHFSKIVARKTVLSLHHQVTILPSGPFFQILPRQFVLESLRVMSKPCGFDWVLFLWGWWWSDGASNRKGWTTNLLLTKCTLPSQPPPPRPPGRMPRPIVQKKYDVSSRFIFPKKTSRCRNAPKKLCLIWLNLMKLLPSTDLFTSAPR